MENLIIAGRVGQDATIKEFNGNQYTSFSIAVDNSYKNQEGTKVEQTNWYNCLKSGTGLAGWIKKGQFLVVSGQPKPKLYKDQNGQTQISLNMRVEQVTLGPNPNPSTSTGTASSPQSNNAVPAAMQSNSTAPMDSDDDLPF